VRRLTSSPTTAKTHTGYCTSQATRKAPGVNPPIAVSTAPISVRTTTLAENPPRLTMLCATPRLDPGFEVRAMSMPTTEPGPPAARTTTSSTSSQRGAGPDWASTAVQIPTLAAITASSNQDRRIGWRTVSTPCTGPITIVHTSRTAQ
jgi:hypothetical protein